MSVSILDRYVLYMNNKKCFPCNFIGYEDCNIAEKTVTLLKSQSSYPHEVTISHGSLTGAKPVLDLNCIPYMVSYSSNPKRASLCELIESSYCLSDVFLCNMVVCQHVWRINK